MAMRKYLHLNLLSKAKMMVDSRDDALISSIDTLLDRVSTLEALKRVKDELKRLKIWSCRFVKVPDDYYSRTMLERAKCLNPCDVGQMCKSIVFENVGWDGDKSLPLAQQMSDLTNSRYYLLVVQYNAKFAADKLRQCVMQMRPEGERLSRNKCNFQLASDGEALTGFTHNAVCPFGLLNKIPVVLSTACVSVKPGYIYMGGGAVNVKLGLSTQDFIKATGAIIADVSEPR